MIWVIHFDRKHCHKIQWNASEQTGSSAKGARKLGATRTVTLTPIVRIFAELN